MEQQKASGELTFVEPFAGGANVGLAMLLEGYAKYLHLAEVDTDVAAFWETVTRHPDWLVEQILYFPQKRQVLLEVMRLKDLSIREKGFVTLLRNRTARGGVIGSTGGLLRRGENGNGVFSRWYPDTLAKRVEAIKSKLGSITFSPNDGFELIEKLAPSSSSVLFLDPPYSYAKTSAGHRLYGHSDVSFERLIDVCRVAKARYVLCYEDSDVVRRAAATIGAICRTVKVRNSHNALTKEVIISNDPVVATLEPLI